MNKLIFNEMMMRSALY